MFVSINGTGTTFEGEQKILIIVLWYFFYLIADRNIHGWKDYDNDHIVAFHYYPI